MKVLLTSVVLNSFVTPWTVDCQAPLFMEFFRQEYWSGLPTSPGGLPDLGIDLGLLHCRQILYHLSHQGSPTWEHQFSSVQLLSHVRLYVTPWTAARQASLSITNSQSLLKLMSIESVMPSNHLILLSFPSPPASNPSPHQSLFQWVNSSHQVAKVLEFQL